MLRFDSIQIDLFTKLTLNQSKLLLETSVVLKYKSKQIKINDEILFLPLFFPNISLSLSSHLRADLRPRCCVLLDASE